MKKPALTLLILAIALHAAAQLSIIPKAGASLSKMAGDDDTEINSKFGFAVA
jgi:hypothetical protein